jgi:twitching motility protein PilT
MEHGYLTRSEVEQVLRYQRELLRRLQAEAHLFGRVAMSLKLLNKEQLRDCLAQQQSSAFTQRIGETAIERGHITPAQVEQILRRQKEVKASIAAEVPRFGKFALKLGLISAAELDDCVREQEKEGSIRRIGEICVAKGFLQPADVKTVLQKQAEAREAPKQASPDSSRQPERAEPSRQPERAEPEPSRQPERASPDSSRQPEPPIATMGERAGPPLIDQYLRFMIEKGASDLHISTNCHPHIRVDGKMKKFGREPLGAAEVRELMMGIITPRALKEFEETNDADFGYYIEGLSRFRVNYFVDRQGMGVVLRQIPYEILTTEEVGLPSKITDLCWLPKGLVLVTGPTGSGKSTTLAAMIDFINRNRCDHIITIEDPIEFVHPNKQCLVNQREVGNHTESFKQALRAALREDPDVVLVGELRDLETVAIAIETAETGHLVFGTLHTTSATSTVDRIIDQFPSGQQAQIRTMLAESLRGVVAQMLCQKIGGGRVPAFEFLLSTPAVSNLIREGKTEQLTSVMQTGKRLGMQVMNDHLFDLVKDGLVEPLEAYLKSNDKRLLKKRFEEARIPLPAGAAEEEN